MPADAIAQPEEQLLPLWADNAAAVTLFGRCCTQWNYAGMGGVPTGLRYEALPFLMRLQGVPRDEQQELVDCLQIMEVHAMKVMTRNRKAGHHD